MRTISYLSFIICSSISTLAAFSLWAVNTKYGVNGLGGHTFYLLLIFFGTAGTLSGSYLTSFQLYQRPLKRLLFILLGILAFWCVLFLSILVGSGSSSGTTSPSTGLVFLYLFISSLFMNIEITKDR